NQLANAALTVRRDRAPPPRGSPAVTTEAGAEVCLADVTAARVAAAGAGATDAVWTSTAAHRCPAGGRRSSDRTRVAAPDTADGPRPARPRSSAASVGR